MPQFSVKVKWGKELYQGVDVNTDEEPIVFKAQIYALTGVLPERQKVMCKGVALKDDDWGNIKLSNGAMILVMGSKEEDVPVEPVEKTKFIEDMNESELASALDLPAGLTNLGNTCYMNAVIQCLKTVPELKAAVRAYNVGTGRVSIEESLLVALRDTWKAMDGSARVPPLSLLGALHAAIPRFSEREQSKSGGSNSGMMGGWAQQDANECWTEMVRILQQKLPSSGSSAKSVVDKYFGVKLTTEMKCVESEDEPISKGEESYLQLSCFISQDVKYLQSGLRSKMQEQITKLSSVLDRDAIFTKTAKINRLPAYLTVQFVRFYYKEKEAINAKILKDVKFPMELDVFELCAPELQEKLMPMRDKFKEIEDAKVEASLSSKDKKIVKSPKDTKKKTFPFSFEDDPGSCNSGLYTLQAVLTHKGRSSSSGHYVAWIKWSASKTTTSQPSWLKCDDDDVSVVTEEEILKLSGGGDWHCAYVLLYGPRVLEVDEDIEQSTDSEKKPEKMETDIE